MSYLMLSIPLQHLLEIYLLFEEKTLALSVPKARNKLTR